MKFTLFIKTKQKIGNQLLRTKSEDKKEIKSLETYTKKNFSPNLFRSHLVLEIES